MARLTKAIMAASPNVVRLPTAAPRAVDNLRYSAQRKACRAARAAEPWPGGRALFPGEHEARRMAEVLCSTEQTPALLLVTALLEALDTETRDKVRRKLAPHAESDRPAHRQAAAAVEVCCPLTVGEAHNLFNAIDHVTGRR